MGESQRPRRSKARRPSSAGPAAIRRSKHGDRKRDARHRGWRPARGMIAALLDASSWEELLAIP